MEFRVSSCIIDSLFPRIENIYIYIKLSHNQCLPLLYANKGASWSDAASRLSTPLSRGLRIVPEPTRTGSESLNAMPTPYLARDSGQSFVCLF